jgi:hypothetical protein
MTSFAVLRERGAAWDASRPLAEQPGWDEHASFMNALAEEGFVVLGGPLGDGGSIRPWQILLGDPATLA